MCRQLFNIHFYNYVCFVFFWLEIVRTNKNSPNARARIRTNKALQPNRCKLSSYLAFNICNFGISDFSFSLRIGFNASDAQIHFDSYAQPHIRLSIYANMQRFFSLGCTYISLVCFMFSPVYFCCFAKLFCTWLRRNYFNLLPFFERWFNRKEKIPIYEAKYVFTELPLLLFFFSFLLSIRETWMC